MQSTYHPYTLNTINNILLNYKLILLNNILYRVGVVSSEEYKEEGGIFQVSVYFGFIVKRDLIVKFKFLQCKCI